MLPLPRSQRSTGLSFVIRRSERPGCQACYGVRGVAIIPRLVRSSLQIYYYKRLRVDVEFAMVYCHAFGESRTTEQDRTEVDCFEDLI